MTGYYDIILGLIPLAMAGITASLLVAGFELTTAIPMASVVTVGLIGHAMFVRAPVDPVPSDASTQQGAQSDPLQTAD
ncbi:hypothetical protein BVU17_03920 [Haloarcula taiwanensis]|uniref:Uncharacterized protein n=1 Tax=Haloarcula taiwanensis TaxID=1932004 RepID=A0A2H4ZW52_9EURY|nr:MULTISPECIES: hypothetical protein [Haloarcula]AUG46708.1 hypothetical protein BVU17_03920 [Haloarcula taiwanensis]RLM44700.1 hypothetical protein DVK00_09580 [Haloarcula sp. Atlit-47R]RLN01589.1 hypothetical protein D3D01_01865 [Haloarcula sp. Atlit-7R]